MEIHHDPQLFCYECEMALDDGHAYLCISCDRYACGNHSVPCQECDYNSCSNCMIAHRNEHRGTIAVEVPIQELLDIHSAVLDLVEDALQIARRIRRISGLSDDKEI